MIPAIALYYLYRRVRSADQRRTDEELQKTIRERQVDIQRNETIIKILQEKRHLTQEIMEVAPYIPEIKKTLKALKDIKEKKGIARKVAYLTEENQEKSEEIDQIKEYLGKHSKISWGRLIFSKWTYAPYFIVVVILLPNICFALYHYFRSGGYDAAGNLLPPQPFWIWAVQGPFFIFIVSGMVITLIGMRYGWGSAILTHGIWNAMLVMLSAAAMVGGLT
jgi:hypothetical protein